MDNSCSLIEGVLNWAKESNSLGVFTTDMQLDLQTVNNWLEIRSQVKASEITGRNLFEVYPEIVNRKLDHYYKQAIEGQQVALSYPSHEYLIQLTSHYVDYKYMQQHVLIAPLISNNKIVGTITVIEDITDRLSHNKEFDEKLRVNIRARDEWEITFDSVPDLIAIIDKEYRIVRINKPMAERLGVKPKDAIGKLCYEFVHNTTHPPIFCPHSKLIEDGQSHSVDIYEENLKGFFNVTVAPFYGSNTSIISSIHIARDITERIKTEQLLKDESLTDALTGLYNRRGFMTLTEQLMNTSNRLYCITLLLFIDLNDIKFINDTFGPLKRDQSLKDAAIILRNTFRETDVICRYGGDEFIVSAMQTGRTDYDAIIQRLNKNVDLYNAEANNVYKLSFSIGVAMYNPETPISLEELISQADTLMHKNKQMLRSKNENA